MSNIMMNKRFHQFCVIGPPMAVQREKICQRHFVTIHIHLVRFHPNVIIMIIIINKRLLNVNIIFFSVVIQF